ncbi:MAG: hypothetical protein ACUVX9_13005 [Anaerolineae bacterium]
MGTYYSMGGISKLPTTSDKLDGWTEVFLYNPTSTLCRARITAYFEDREPVTLDPAEEIKPQNSHLLVMPRWHPEVFNDAGFWALKLETNTALDPIVIQVMKPYEDMAKDTTFKGGVSNLLPCQLHREWYFADGLWLNWTDYLKGDIAKAPFPFNELEYYYFLNPGDRPAQVDMTLQFRRLEPMTFHLKVPARRLLAWCNWGKIPYNQPYGVKVASTEPIATTSVRYIYGLRGFDEWGIQLHCAMPAKPGPWTAW